MRFKQILITKKIKHFLRYLSLISQWQKENYKREESQTNSSRLTEKQKEQIKSYWGHLYDSEIQYETFYNQYNDSFDPRFLPGNLYFRFLGPYLTTIRTARIIDDKNLYDYLINDIRRPVTVARVVHGECYDEKFQPISIFNLIRLCGKFDKVIIKPSVLFSGSSGIIVLKEEDYKTRLPQLISKGKNYIIQEFIEQHEELSSLHIDSINTVRLLALNWRGNVKVLSGILRMGVNGSKMDDYSVGGISVGIEDSGRLKHFAYNLSGKRFDKHPQGEYFDAHYVPNYQELVKLCTYLTPRFAAVSRLVSWVFAIGKDGHPFLIEVNPVCGELDFHQLANGPIFGDTGKEILDIIFRNKRNRVYRWWFNRVYDSSFGLLRLY